MSRFQPANTDRRRSRIALARTAARDSSPAAARRVCCRGGAVRSPEASGRKRSSSRLAICSTDSARTLAAASSMASGMPSRVRHSRATASALSLPSANPDRAAEARSANSCSASCRARSARDSGSRPACTDSGGTRHTVSPRTRSGSRLVAITRSDGQLASSCCTSSAHPCTTCSQVSRTISSCRARRASARVAIRGRSCSSRIPNVAATRRGMRSASAVSASSTSQVPSGNSGTRSQASRTARRVFPIPPGPHRVRARTSLSKSASSLRSRSLPMKLFGSAGRLPGAGGAAVVMASGTVWLMAGASALRGRFFHSQMSTGTLMV